MEDNLNTTVDVYYSGHVQGVGFRYQVYQIAKEFEITGFVRNLNDGRVQLRAHGNPEVVERFLEETGYQLEAYIRKTERKEPPDSGPFREFIIR